MPEDSPQNNHNDTPDDNTTFDSPAAPQPAQHYDQPPAVKSSNTVQLVWQWLTYALWSWTLASLSILLTTTLIYFIDRHTASSSDYSYVVYLIATTLCLLPAAYFVDRNYSRQEPEHKHGFAAVILVLHAVFAFLISVGALITAVVTLLSLATDISGDNSNKAIIIVSSLLISLLGGLFFVRIIQPEQLARISRRFRLVVTIFTLIVIIVALAGPYAGSISSRTDRQLDAGLSGVDYAIQDYVSDNSKLPDNLGQLNADDYGQATKQVIDKNLVSYRQLSNNAAQLLGGDSFNGTSIDTSSNQKLRYELCVTYKKAAGNGTAPSDDSAYIDTSSHPAGHTCYNQTATTY